MVWTYSGGLVLSITYFEQKSLLLTTVGSLFRELDRTDLTPDFFLLVTGIVTKTAQQSYFWGSLGKQTLLSKNTALM